MNDEELEQYAEDLINEHATDIEYLTIFEMAEDWTEDGTISDEDAEKVLKLIGKAVIEIHFEE